MKKCLDASAQEHIRTYAYDIFGRNTMVAKVAIQQWESLLLLRSPRKHHDVPADLVRRVSWQKTLLVLSGSSVVTGRLTAKEIRTLLKDNGEFHGLSSLYTYILTPLKRHGWIDNFPHERSGYFITEEGQKVSRNCAQLARVGGV